MAATKVGRFLSDPCPLTEKLSCPCSRAPSFGSSLEHFMQAATFRSTLRNAQRSTHTLFGQNLNERRASDSSHRRKECSRIHCANLIASLNQPKILFPSTSISRTGSKTHWKEPSSNSRERLGRLQAVKTEAPVDERKAEWGSELEAWLGESGLPEQPVEIADVGPKGLGVQAKRVILKGEVALQVPEHLTVTGVDVANHPVVANIAEGRGDVIGLTLWVMYERSLGEQSGWWPFVRMFPRRTRSPLLWTSEQQNELLRGSPVLVDVQERLRAVESEYAQLSTFFSGDPELFLPPFFSFEAFKETFAVVLSRVVFLPSADCFALVPFADCINHASDSTASLDFSADENAVILTADRDYQPGDEVVITYGADKPNSELLINYGFVDPNNSNDCLFQPAELLPTDRLMGFKKQIVEQAGFGVKELFPLLLNRFPTQLLVYLRLSRLQDPAQFPKVNFEKDMVVSQENEYEILMLLMADMRERLQSYENQTEDELRLLNTRDLSPEGRLACQLRIGEQRILQSTMTAVRNRLAPIRGVPTKSGGMQDPNADIIEMFDQVESIVSAPGKFFQKVLGRDK